MNGLDHATEFALFEDQLLPAGRGQLVIARTAVIFRRTPRGFNPAVQEQALQRGIKRAFSDLKDIVRDLFQSLRDAVAVHSARQEGSQNEEVERTGKKLGRIGWVSHRLSMEG